jgi:hypothetical protein
MTSETGTFEGILEVAWFNKKIGKSIRSNCDCG